MPMLKLITPASVPPVTLDEAKLQLRVDQNEEDALIQSLISAATADCEFQTQRMTVESTLELVLEAFPLGAITLPRPPVSEVESITYKDSGGNEQTVPAGEYSLDGNDNASFIIPIPAWPQGVAVRVRYKAGWPVDGSGKTKTPDALKAWILNRVSGMYQQRSSFVSSSSGRGGVTAMPRDFMAGLLDRYRLYGPELEL